MTRAIGIRAMLAAMLTMTMPSRSHEQEATDWWGRFIREMEALGCKNIRQNPETGEWEFDCPAAKLKAARAIVARYATRE